MAGPKRPGPNRRDLRVIVLLRASRDIEIYADYVEMLT